VTDQATARTLEPTPLERELELEREAKVLRAQGGLLNFTLSTFPTDFDVNWHHKAMCRALNRFAQGTLKRLIITLPPRHSKSQLVSRQLPAWLLGRNPRAKIIGTSYSDSLASSMNRDVQRLIETEAYREIFPDTRLRGDRLAIGTTAWLKNSGIFEIVNYGGCYRSAGVGGSITGVGGNYIILDDFCKNQEEADSELMRNRTFEWFGSTLYTRLEKDAGLLITATRWHEDDLVGRLLKLAKDDAAADQWEVISFPAMSEGHPHELDPRSPGEALWPSRYDKTRLAGIKASIGTRNWSALYQQRPAPEEGMIVNREWWQFYKALPLSFDKIIQAWDLTFTKSATSDFVVGVVLGKVGANIYLLDMIRDRLSFTSSIAAMKRMCSRWPQADAKYVEAAANGHALIDTLRSEIPGLIPVKPTGSKVARANAVSPLVESGNVWLPEKALAPWIDDVVEEWTSFPAGAHDDIVDAMCHGILKLKAEGPMDYLPLSLKGGTVFPRNP